MEPAHYTDPLEEALSHGSQRVAQLASLAAAMAQVVIQRRALEQARKAVLGDHPATRVVDDQERLLHRQARLSWASAHDAQWLAQAGFIETARAWAGAAGLCRHRAVRGGGHAQMRGQAARAPPVRDGTLRPAPRRRPGAARRDARSHPVVRPGS